MFLGMMIKESAAGDFRRCLPVAENHVNGNKKFAWRSFLHTKLLIK